MIVLYILVIILSSFIGVMISQTLKKRYLYFKELCDFLDYYKQNLIYLQNSMSDLVLSAANKTTELKETLVSFNKFIQGEKLVLNFPPYLNKEQKGLVENIFERLGSGDFTLELDKTEKARFEVSRQGEYHKNIYDKYGGVAIKISVLLGIMLVIILL